nr:MAG TPA: hypothetical protein [Bacteriophage sp.]
MSAQTYLRNMEIYLILEWHRTTIRKLENILLVILK